MSVRSKPKRSTMNNANAALLSEVSKVGVNSRHYSSGYLRPHSRDFTKHNI